MRKTTQSFENPIVFPLLAAICWVVSLTLIKSLIGKIPFTQLLFFWFIFRSILNFQSPSRPISLSLKTSLFSIHILLAFVSLAFYYSLFGALSNLPLTNLTAIYLTFPLFIPWVLRVWMGKKINPMIILGSSIIWVGILFTFNSRFGINNVAVFLALMAALLKAIHWVGHRRLGAFDSPYRIWAYESLVSTCSAALLLISSWRTFRVRLLLVLALALFLDFIAQKFLNSQKNGPIPLSLKASLFNLAIFLGCASDLIFFHAFPPFKPFLCAILIYFGLFLTFFKKNILPNPVYQL